jgi:hypothetical protein
LQLEYGQWSMSLCIEVEMDGNAGTRR